MSAALNQDRAEILPATAQLRMIGDRILLRPLDVQWSDHIIVARKGRPVRGEVMAVGPGRHPLKYKPSTKPGHKLAVLTGRFQPTEVKVGDIVELGGLNVFDGEGYSFPEVIIGGERMLIITERDVAGVVEP